MKKRIFRDKKGRIVSTKNLNKIKSVKIGKKTYTSKTFIKKLVLNLREKLKPKKKRKKEKVFVPKITSQTYQTQLGKLGAYYNIKYQKEIPLKILNSLKKFVNFYLIFFDAVEKHRKAVRVKFGIIFYDKEQDRGAAWYTPYLDIFEKGFKKLLIEPIAEMFEKIKNLSEKYEMKITKAEAEQIFYVLGNL